MSAVTVEYPKSLLHAIAPTTDTLKVMLLAGASFNVAHEFLTDVSADEITGTGYVAGGQTLTTVVASYDSATKTYTFTCDDPVWDDAIFTTGSAVIFQDTGTDSTSPLMVYIDFGASQSPSNVDWSLACPETGFMTRGLVSA
jgi:hypothetical protein